MAADPLDGMWLKIDRANKHIREFRKAIDKYLWLDGGLYRGVKKVDSHGVAHDAVQIARPVPGEVSLPAGDALHNLRSALDHLAFALCFHKRLARAKAKDLRAVEFPIGKDREAFNRAMRKGVVGKASAAAVKYLESVKPYNRGNAYLWLLHSLDIVDKHRSLLVMRPQTTRVRIILDGGSEITLSQTISLKEGVPTSPAAYGYSYGQVQFSPDVAFNHVMVKKEPATIILDQISARVQIIAQQAKALF